AYIAARRNNFMRIRIGLLCVLMIGGLACSKKPNDTKISQDIQTKASSDPIVQGSELYVNSNEGRVTLTGKAKDQAAREQIESIAKSEPGVVDVQDNTELVSTASTSELTQPAYSEPVPSASAVRAAAPPPPPKPIVVPAGTTLTIRTNQPLGSKTSHTGAVFSGSILTPITIDGEVVIPAGAEVTGIVKEAKKAGKIKGAAVLRLALESVTVQGHTYNLQAEELAQTSTGKGKRSAAVIGGGTGLGAVIGGIAGGGKGAAIGALTGAAAGTIGAATTGKREIDLPAEAALSFRLAQPLTLKRS
ncbi:MAG TPA: BON domain-containing protein, partial [Terriglobales bacterium]|nr:BON domain-containing protein [Terriglobales bacterium]